jgi:hypothetical protein
MASLDLVADAQFEAKRGTPLSSGTDYAERMDADERAYLASPGNAFTPKQSSRIASTLISTPQEITSGFGFRSGTKQPLRAVRRASMICRCGNGLKWIS